MKMPPKRFHRNKKKILILLIVISVTGCGKERESENQKERIENWYLCYELKRALPTWSEDDTEESLRSAENFLSVFDIVCPDSG